MSKWETYTVLVEKDILPGIEACLRFFKVSERLKNPNMDTAHVMGDTLATEQTNNFVCVQAISKSYREEIERQNFLIKNEIS